jgi:thiol-disulfide isomerase/thioredoxin
MAENPQGGEPAPEFRLPTLAGEERTLDELLEDGRPLLIVFMMPGCGPCKSMRPAVARWADAYPDRVRVAVMSRYHAAANAEAYEEFPRLEVLIDEDAEVTKAFGVFGTPAAVLVGSDGRVRGGLASGERLVRRLLAAALAGTEPDLASPHEDSGAPADSLDLDSVVLPRPTVTSHEADGATVLVDEETGAGATLDQVGAIIWSVLDGGSLREIVDDLADAFQAPPEVVGPDVLTMVRSLGRAGMLAGVVAEAASDEVDPVAETASAP